MNLINLDPQQAALVGEAMGIVYAKVGGGEASTGTRRLPRWNADGTEVTSVGQVAAAMGVKTDVAAHYALESKDASPELVVDALTHLELKVVRHVRTPAGKKKYGQPIGSIIVRDGASPLKNLVSIDDVYDGASSVRGADGNDYHIAKAEDDGKWYALNDDADWDHPAAVSKTEAGVYQALDKKIGSGDTASKPYVRPPNIDPNDPPTHHAKPSRAQQAAIARDQRAARQAEKEKADFDALKLSDADRRKYTRLRGREGYTHREALRKIQHDNNEAAKPSMRGSAAARPGGGALRGHESRPTKPAKNRDELIQQLRDQGLTAADARREADDILRNHGQAGSFDPQRDMPKDSLDPANLKRSGMPTAGTVKPGDIVAPPWAEDFPGRVERVGKITPKGRITVYYENGNQQTYKFDQRLIGFTPKEGGSPKGVGDTPAPKHGAPPAPDVEHGASIVDKGYDSDATWEDYFKKMSHDDVAAAHAYLKTPKADEMGEDPEALKAAKKVLDEKRRIMSNADQSAAAKVRAQAIRDRATARNAQNSIPDVSKAKFYTSTAAGKNEAQYAAEVASDSGRDPGFRIEGNNIVVYNPDDALHALEGIHDIHVDNSTDASTAGEKRSASAKAKALKELMDKIKSDAAVQKESDKFNAAINKPENMDKLTGIQKGHKVTLGQARSGSLVYTVEAINGDNAVIADSSGSKRSVKLDRLHAVGGSKPNLNEALGKGKVDKDGHALKPELVTTASDNKPDGEHHKFNEGSKHVTVGKSDGKWWTRYSDGRSGSASGLRQSVRWFNSEDDALGFAGTMVDTSTPRVGKTKVEKKPTFDEASKEVRDARAALGAARRKHNDDSPEVRAANQRYKQAMRALDEAGAQIDGRASTASAPSTANTKEPKSIAKTAVAMSREVDAFNFTRERQQRLQDEYDRWVENATPQELIMLRAELLRMSSSGALTTREKAAAKTKADQLTRKMKGYS